MTAKQKKKWPIVLGFILVVIVLIVAIKLPDFRAYQKRIAVFPLTKGTYWIYQGPTKWTVANSNKVVERTMTWKMEVVNTIQQGMNFIAVLKGHPGDLAWYEEGKERGDYLLIRRGIDKYYFILQDKVIQSILDRSKAKTSIDDLLDDDRLYINLPLYPGKKWGNPDFSDRTDNAYCWYVVSSKNIELRDIKGLISNPTVTQYELQYYTNPDHEILKFAEGVGITAFQYIHHGTISETNLRLIEFHKGND